MIPLNLTIIKLIVLYRLSEESKRWVRLFLKSLNLLSLFGTTQLEKKSQRCLAQDLPIVPFAAHPSTFISRFYYQLECHLFSFFSTTNSQPYDPIHRHDPYVWIRGPPLIWTARILPFVVIRLKQWGPTWTQFDFAEQTILFYQNPGQV